MFRSHEPVRQMSLAAIQSGDLLAWRKDSHSTMSDFLIAGIRLFTNAKHGHVGIAWRCHDGLDDELFVIEATIPKIRVARVVADLDFDCIPMGVDWSKQSKDFLVEKLGWPYSTLDAFRAYLGIKLKDDKKFQCVELAHDFYELCGIKLEHNYTPKGIVECAERYSGQKALRVVQSTSRTGSF